MALVNVDVKYQIATIFKFLTKICPDARFFSGYVKTETSL